MQTEHIVDRPGKGLRHHFKMRGGSGKNNPPLPNY